ncbi:DNA-dependent protein kinase catalytic subunit [Sergentomyia squamirostris]
MNEKLSSTISLLKRKIDGQRPKEATNSVTIITGAFDDAPTNSEIDLAIDIIFNANHGTISILFQSIQHNKMFKQCNIDIFQLHLRIIREYSEKMSNYVPAIIQYTTKYIIANNVSAKEKELCMQIIQEMLLKKLCGSVDLPAVLDKLFRVFNDPDPRARLHQLTFEVVGLICKDFPEHFVGTYQQRFHDAIVTKLDSLLTKKDAISLVTIAGAIEGLNSYLIHFPPDNANDREYIYKCVKELSDVGDIREKALFRNSMQLLTSHTNLLAEQLLRDYKFWHDTLDKWLKYTYEDKRIAINAISAVHKQLAASLIARRRAEDAEVLQFFFKYFQKVLQSSTAKPYEIRIAIQGFGLMAGPCRAIVPADQMDNLVNLVIQATDHAYFTEKINKREQMEHLADFMESLSQILVHMPFLSQVQIKSLETMMIDFIKDFHFLSTAHHESVIRAVMNTFVNCSRLEGTVFNDILYAVVRQGIIWTCSRKLPYDAFRDENHQDWKDNVTYRSYLSLWRGMFNAWKRPQFKNVAAKVYEAFVASIPDIIEKLDLRTKKRTYKDENDKDEEFAFCDPNIDLQSVKPEDYHIFLNLVNFFHDIVSEQTAEHHSANFNQWIHKFCSLLVINIQKYPLISGFLKLFELILNVAHQINYLDEEHYATRYEVHDFVAYLLKTIIQRAQFTSGELQIACLQAILSGPTAVLMQFPKELCEILRIAFDIGKSLLWVANKALTAVFGIVKSDSTSDDFKELMQNILPCLDVFLQSKGFADPSALSVEIVKHQNRRRIRKKIQQIDTDSELLKFQKRIYKLIGLIEPEICWYFAKNKTSTNLTKWDTDSSIKLKIHCNDISPIICLDPLLPRIFQLALSSSDRKVKISSCELLHGIVLYMIGIPVRSQKIWIEMWKQLLLLGCDNDVAVQQMFEPLLVQVMHYKAQPNQDGVSDLIDVLMENLSHPSNAAVRDLAARCLREFVSWTFKQNTAEDGRSLPPNIVKIIKRLELYCWNFNVYERLGASLGFNNLYRILREEENLVNTYWIMLAYLYCINLRLCTKSSSFQYEAIAIEQASIALDHVVRVLCEKSDLFAVDQEGRLKPHALDEATLKSFAIWLFQECGSHSKIYREKCSEIFMRIVPQIKEYGSIKRFLGGCLLNEDILMVCEGKEGVSGIANHPDLCHISSNDTNPIKMIYEFLQSFLTDLDNQIWLLGGDFIQNPQDLVRKSKIFHAIDYYLENICRMSGSDILSKLNIELSFETYDRKENELNLDILSQIEDIKAVLSAKLMDYFTKVVQHCGQQFPVTFWRKDSPIIKFVIDLIFQPHALGLNFRHREITDTLQARKEVVLMRLKRDTPIEFSESLTNTIEEEFKINLMNAVDIMEKAMEDKLVKSIYVEMIDGIFVICEYVKVSSFTPATEKRYKQISDMIGKKLFDFLATRNNDEIYQRTLSHKTIETFKMLLKLTFYNKDTLHKVIEYIFNVNELKRQDSSGEGQLKQGEYFYEIYRHELLTYFVSNLDAAISGILEAGTEATLKIFCRLINDLCEFIFERPHERPKGKILIDGVISSWESISSHFEAWRTTFKLADLDKIELISKIALISPQSFWETGKKMPGLEEWLLSLICNQEISKEIKVKALELLPMITGPQDRENGKLAVALQTFQSAHLPLISSEFKAESMERAGLVVTIQTLLDALVASQSPILLKFFIDATAGDQNHIMEYEIEKNLRRCIRLMAETDQVGSLQLSFDIFCNSSLEPGIRLIVSRRFLKTIIRSCRTNTIIAFFEKNIKKVVELTDTSYGMTGKGWVVEQALVSRAGGYELIECLFSMVEKDRLDTVSHSLLGTPGTEIVKYLTKKAFKVRSEVFMSDDDVASEFFRKYQCHAYSALCTIVSNTQDQLRFYEGLLFKEDSAKNEFIWQRVVNCRNVQLYSNIEQEFMDYPKVKGLMVSIKRSAKKTEDGLIKFSHTNNVFMSSLSQEVTRFDFTHAAIRNVADAATVDTDRELASVELENVDINRHELMAMLCALINGMYEKKISPVVEDMTNPRRSIPQWVNSIAEAIYSRHQHKNVRIFLCKLVDNCRNVFKYYCSVLMAPLMQFIVDECAGSCLNSFITGLVALILEWSEFYLPKSCDEASVAKSLLSFLMKNCYHSRPEIFKLNLDLINRLVHLWKDFVMIERQVLYDLVTKNCSNDSKDNICGIQLNAIVLSCGIIPWIESTKINYLKALFACLDNDFKMIYQTASHLLGMCVKYINPDGEIDDDPCSKELKQKIEMIKRTSEDKFVNVIYGIQKNYPKILEPFMIIITHLIPSAFGSKKKVCLEMFLSGMITYGDTIFREIIAIGIRDILRQNDHQVLGLHIINKATRNMSKSELSQLSGDLLAFAEHRTVECRDLMYEILINTVQTLKDRSETESDMYKQYLATLLNGLSDEDSNIQNRIFKFWSDDRNLSQQLKGRFLAILESLYDPTAERHFLEYATQLLLDLPVHNPNSKDQLFINQMELDDKLKEYDIDVSWRSRTNQSLVPLFVESQQRQVIVGSSMQMSKMLRATASQAVFQPTQDPTMITKTPETFTLSTQNSLMFTLPPEMLDRNSKQVTPSEGNVIKQPASDLRKRFIRDQERLRKEHALKAIERRHYETSRKINTKKAKENEVVLYRRYRFGDFPDLLINGLALLLPLQALVKKDAIIARHIFMSLYDGIISTDTVNTGDFQRNLKRHISEILNTSKHCESIIFATFMQVAVSDPEIFKLSPDTVTLTSIASSMVPSATLYLEACLNFMNDSECDVAKELWVKLAELYQNLSESDMVSGIFSDKLKTNPQLSKAIDCESRGDFITAKRMYTNLIGTTESIEQNFCYESLYNCYMKMGQWSELAANGNTQVDSLEELWTDDWDREKLLPCLMKSNMREMLDERECQEFLDALEKWLRISDRCVDLRMNFAEEIIMVETANQDYQLARVHSEQNFTYFLSEWGNLSTLSDKVRAEKLFNLRRVAEIHRCIEILLSQERSEKVDSIINDWKNTTIRSNDSLLMWDFLLAYRSYFSKEFKKSNFDIDTCIVDMNVNFLDAAISQKNVALAQRSLKSLQAVQNIEGPNSIKWKLANCRLRNLKVENRHTPEAMKSYMASVKEINSIVTSTSMKDYALDLQLQILSELVDATSKVSINMPKVIMSEELKEDIKSLTPDLDVEDMNVRLRKQSFAWLMQSVNVAKEISNSSEGQAMVKVLGNAYYKMAAYCHDRLERETSMSLEFNFVISVLKGMEFNSREAMNLFPSLLEMDSLVTNRNLVITFQKSSRPIPEWMFLKWVPQILSRFNFAAPCYLDKILRLLAQTYPAAIFYAFTMSYNQYLDGLNTPNHVNRAEVNNILNLIRNSGAQKFISALSCLCLPKLMLSCHLFELSNVLNKDSSMACANKMIDKILKNVFGEGRDNMQGSAFKQLEKYLPVIKELKTESTVTNLLQKLSSLMKALKDEKDKQRYDSIEAEKLCPWMANFNPTEENLNLELPGQYLGDQKPLVEYHVKIARFDPKLQIFRSLRRPMKLTVIGTDGKRHEYLVKYGEDLRQDQRIQQLLRLMSTNLQLDEQCKNNNLFIQTYQVIPVTQYCGMTTWVHGTAIMKDFVKRSLKPGVFNAIENTILGEFKGYFNISDSRTYWDYGEMVKKNSRERIGDKFTDLEEKLPEDLIRKALWNISISPECYFVLRNNFAKSLATMNIAHWILGIGDRHLGNLLLNTQNGHLVGIDFGLVFGGATINQAIPELIPFRLTPKMVNVMNPFGVSGLMKKCMTHALRSFVSCRKTIMACMSVFIQEPTLDWQSSSNTSGDAEHLPTNDRVPWNSLKRIEIAKKKLNGANPKSLIAEELSMSWVAKLNIADGYSNILEGDESLNIRARLGDQNLTVEDQVSCLIDLATDPAILGVCYMHFMPWI